MNVPLACLCSAGAFLVMLTGTAAFAGDAPGISIEIENGSPNMRTTARYDCAGETAEVEYINVEPDHLAIVPVEGQKRVFVLVMSGSGARYASGRYIWWSKGGEASLYDEIEGADAPPVLTCSQ